MNPVNYQAFAFESFKITLFCLIITGLFKIFGVSNESLLVIFNMAVMSAAATFSVDKKHLNHVALGSSVVALSTVMGGFIGFYCSWLASILTIIYAGSAFYFPKTKQRTNIFVTGALMFFIFSALPFSWNFAVKYTLYGVIIVLLFTGFYCLFEYKKSKEAITKPEVMQENHRTAIIAIISLTLSWLISYCLHLYTPLSHLYWLGLTILLVIQGSQQKTIHTAIKRIGVNAVGAVVIVFLFGYIIPENFWINFIILVVFLFLIFALGFSYVWRVFFIELFVFGFTHSLGNYQEIYALDRVILTAIGGIIVIAVTLVVYQLKLSKV